MEASARPPSDLDAIEASGRVCPSCGNRNLRSYRFCTRCGRNLLEAIPQATPPQGRLAVLQPPQPRPSIAISGLATIGSGQTTLALPADPDLEALHARISLGPEGFVLEDAGSRAGTFLQVRGAMPITEGDVVVMGMQAFRFRTGAPAVTGDDAAGPPSSPRAWPGESTARIERLVQSGRVDGVYPLTSDDLVVGRTEGSVTFPEDPRLSPRHGVVRTVHHASGGPTHVILDLGSQFGTWLRVRGPTLLRARDRILVGRSILVFE